MSGEIPYQGACLYVPATHPSLPRVLSGEAVPGLRVAVVCLEDAVTDREVPAALERLRQESGVCAEGLRVYVRPRDVSMLHELLNWSGPHFWQGFVLPKVGLDNAYEWLIPLEQTDFAVMPILETRDVFDPYRLHDLCDLLVDGPWRKRVEVVRIGATDLFAVLATRRPPDVTLYESVLGPTVCLLATQLMARGLHVSAPTCEALTSTVTMAREVARDVEAGFVGKTAVHPRQAVLINEAFRVHPEEHHEAQRILASEAAVFQSRGTMCECRPHARWAERVLARAAVFGLEVVPDE